MRRTFKFTNLPIIKVPYTHLVSFGAIGIVRVVRAESENFAKHGGFLFTDVGDHDFSRKKWTLKYRFLEALQRPDDSCSLLL